MSDKYELSRRKALLGLGTIGVAGAGAGLGTSALFSDEEGFNNNSITAGTTNLKVEMGVAQVNSTADYEDLEINFSQGSTREADGDVRTGVQIGDMKPGDEICVGLNVIVEDNPMYVALRADDITDGEGANPEPEPQPGPDNDSDGIPGGGDLDNALEVTAFGHETPAPNVNTGINPGAINGPTDVRNDEPGASLTAGLSLTELLVDFLGDGMLYRNRTGGFSAPGHGEGVPTAIGGNGNADTDQVTHYVCLKLPESTGNEVQGDTVSFDLVWSAEQVRNNPAPANSTVVDGNVN